MKHQHADGVGDTQRSTRSEGGGSGASRSSDDQDRIDNLLAERKKARDVRDYAKAGEFHISFMLVY